MNGVRAAFEGRVGRDPELRYTAAGKALCTVSVGVPDGKGPLEWLRVTFWEELAEELYECLDKGDLVYVEGRLRLGEWEGQDGQRRASLDVSAWRCEVLGGIGRREPPRPIAAANGHGPSPRSAGGLTIEVRERIAAAAAAGAARAATRPRSRR